MEKMRVMMSEKVTAEMVKELREKTGVGMSKCKEALDQVGGDLQKAIDFLRKAGMTSGAKKEGREVKDGLIFAIDGKDAIALVEMNSETDFVAQTDKFKNFLSNLAKCAAEAKVASLSDLMNLPSKEDASLTNEQYRNVLIQALGENIQVKRVEVIKKLPNTSYGIYSHMGGKLLTIVSVEGALGEESVAKEIAMHVAAESPDYLRAEEVSAEVKAREEEIARSQVKGKPENVMEKIVAGKIKAFFDEICLLNQKYIKDNSLTVEQYVEGYSKKAGKSIKVTHFWRWKVGQ
jgi:elongation factor Ts